MGWPMIFSCLLTLAAAIWSLLQIIRYTGSAAPTAPDRAVEGMNWLMFLCVVFILSASSALILGLGAAWRFTH